MKKSKLINLLLFFIFFNSIFGDDDCSDYIMTKYNACNAVNLGTSEKKCVYINDQCKEQIADCHLYTGSDAAECEAIIPKSDPYRTKCFYDGNYCRAKSITSCTDYKPGLPKEFCNNIYLYNGAKCHLVDNECQTYYSECSHYTGNNQSICESIELESPNKYCSYKDNRCVEERKTVLTCDSYKSGQDREYCNNIYLDNYNKYCLFYNNKCSEYYKYCSDYDGTNIYICHSNIPLNYDLYKCFFREGKCIEQRKICSDYKEGEDYNTCEKIIPDDYKKGCKIIGGQCKEVYKSCEYYEGNKQKECESIIPYDPSRYKCVFNNGSCKTEIKTSCEDYEKGKDSHYCINIQISDNNKHCVFINGECKESYRECYYGENDSYVCDSIITQNGRKCKYEDNTCKDKTMECSEYTLFLDNDGGHSCKSIDPKNEMKKCVYSNYNCKEEDKYCLDFTSYVTKEICEKALTSSNLVPVMQYQMQ